MLHLLLVHYILEGLGPPYLIGYILKNQNGKFYLRVEDTDKERSKDEYKDQIIQSLKWIGINYDGEEYIQSEKVEYHIKIANELLKNGHAYKCYCSSEEIEEQKKEQDKKKFLIFMIENGEIKKNLMLQKISSLL